MVDYFNTWKFQIEKLKTQNFLVWFEFKNGFWEVERIILAVFWVYLVVKKVNFQWWW